MAIVENYLIDADLLWQYWVERQNAPAWSHGPALSKEEIQQHVQESARELGEYQAVRWALARLKPSLRWAEIRTTWTDGSGKIPLSLDFDTCLTQASDLVNQFRSQVDGIDQDQLHRYADEYRERFSDNQFMEEGRYLVWFHGKDHLTQWCRRLADSFPRKSYAEWAAERVDVSRHLDLQQLVSLAG